MAWILRNWHLKIGAVLLATILYTGLVFSGSFTNAVQAGVTIQRINQPNGTYVTTQQLPAVKVSYRVAVEATGGVSADTFAATIDLAQYDMQAAGQSQALEVSVKSLNSGVTVLSFTPDRVPVVVDVVTSKTIPVVVDRGEVPAGLDVGEPTVTPTQVTVSGPRAQVNQVVRAEARVQIDPSGIDVNQPFDLRAVDASGNDVQSVELSEAAALVRISVRTVETSKTVPIRPALAGAPAIGYEIDGVSNDPAVVTLRGAPAALAKVSEVATQPTSVAGLKVDRVVKVALIIPPGVTLADTTQSSVTVTVTIRPQVGSRTFQVGVSCTGAPEGTVCIPQVTTISVTLAGPIASLAALSGAQITPVLDVSGLGPGSHTVNPRLTPPRGITVVGFSPAGVPVVIQPTPTPSP